MSTGGTHAGDRGRQEVTVFWASTRPLCCYFRRNYPVIPIPALSRTLSPLLATGHLVLVTSGERNFHTLVSPRVSDSLSSQLHPALHLPALVWPAPAMNINCLQFYAFQIPGFSHYFANTQKANLPSIDKIPAVGGSADYRDVFVLCRKVARAWVRAFVLSQPSSLLEKKGCLRWLVAGFRLTPLRGWRCFSLLSNNTARTAISQHWPCNDVYFFPHWGWVLLLVPWLLGWFGMTCGSS